MRVLKFVMDNMNTFIMHSETAAITRGYLIVTKFHMQITLDRSKKLLKFGVQRNLYGAPAH